MASFFDKLKENIAESSPEFMEKANKLAKKEKYSHPEFFLIINKSKNS